VRFVHPDYLWLLLALPLLGLAGWWSVQRRRAALARFAGGSAYVNRFAAGVSAHRRAAKLLLLYFALSAGIVAAARPQWGTRIEEVQRRGIDVVILVDTSLSMAAEDVPPSRLGLARHAIHSLLPRLAGDRVALVTFAGRAALECPLTVDHGAVRLFLDVIDVESVPVAGTSLASALEVAIHTLGAPEGGGEARSRAILLFSDGEDHEGGVEEVLDEIERAGIAIHTIGVGTATGAPIPVRDASGASSGYKKDREDKVVTTRLDETTLEFLALESGGRYYRATPGQAELEEIAMALKSLDEQEFGAVLRARYEERYQIPLVVALLALLAETLFGDRRALSRETRLRLHWTRENSR